MGTKLSSTIDREASSGSQYAGTSRRIRSGRTESSALVAVRQIFFRIDRAPLLTFPREIEERGEIPAVGHTGSHIPQFVKERVDHGFNCTQTGAGSILQQLGDEVDGFCRSARPEHLPTSIKKPMASREGHITHF